MRELVRSLMPAEHRQNGYVTNRDIERNTTTVTQERVLVTGGSGFIAGHCILQLLEQGYVVHTTVRSSKRESAVRAVLTDAGMANGDALTFAEADLTRDAGWADTCSDCEYVLHVASPVHSENVKDEDDVIIPARDGALRVLHAARDAGVKRVVLTSALHAVGFGHPHTEVEAAIAALHDEATSAEETDWPQVLAWYDEPRRPHRRPRCARTPPQCSCARSPSATSSVPPPGCARPIGCATCSAIGTGGTPSSATWTS